MLQGLESSGVPREESGAPINNTWVYPAATCHTCAQVTCCSTPTAWLSAGESNTRSTLPTALGFLFRLNDFYFGTEWLRLEENGCSLAVV